MRWGKSSTTRQQPSADTMRQRKGSGTPQTRERHANENEDMARIPKQEPPKAFLEEDEFLEFLYKPHTLMGLWLTVSVLAYLAFGRGKATPEENIHVGVLACCIAFLLYCVLQLR